MSLTICKGQLITGRYYTLEHAFSMAGNEIIYI